MYIVSLKYFDSSGHFLGDGEMLSPGKSQRALMEYETGSPVLIKVGG